MPNDRRQKKPKPFALPKTMGACADLFYLLRAEKTEAAKVVDGIEQKLKLLKAHILDHMNMQDAEGVSGKEAKVQTISKVVPTVTDWDKLWDYIRRNKAYYLLQRRPSAGAFREIWNDGKKVPGVDQYQYFDLSCTKKR